MASWMGPTISNYNQYDELGKISNLLDNETKYQIYDGVILPARKNVTDNQYLKDALVKYGALSVTVHAPQSGPEYNEQTYAAYYNEGDWGDGGNHAVTLVGWNDTFSKSNFATTPPGDGAWIIRNSWGPNWANHGYYYVSYYDNAVATDGIIAFIVDANHTYQKNYQYDVITFPKWFNYSQKASYSNKFISTGNDLITAVGTYFNKTGEKYLINVYVNKELKHTQNGTSTHPGYETIKLDKLVPLKEEDEFIVEMSAGNIVPISRVSRQHYKENTSLIKVGDKATDLSKNGTVVCLKAYAVVDNSYMIVKSNDNIVQVQYYDQDGEKLTNTNVTFIIDGKKYTRTTDDEAIAIFNVSLPSGQYNVTVINPINGKEENTTITIPSDNPTPDNPTIYYPKRFNQNTVKNVVKVPKTYEVKVGDNVVFEGQYFTINSLNIIFGHQFINGHLVVYLDGRVIFNSTVNDNIYTVLFEIIEKYMGTHELKIEFTIGNDTQTYTENITIL